MYVCFIEIGLWINRLIPLYIPKLVCQKKSHPFTIIVSLLVGIVVFPSLELAIGISRPGQAWGFEHAMR